MRKYSLAVPANTGSGAPHDLWNCISPMWVHVSGAVPAQFVVEGATNPITGSVVTGSQFGPYFTMATVPAQGMYQLSGLAEVVRVTCTSGSGQFAVTLLAAEDNR